MDRIPISFGERQLEEDLGLYNPAPDLDRRRLDLIEAAKHRIEQLEADLADAHQPGLPP